MNTSPQLFDLIARASTNTSLAVHLASVYVLARWFIVGGGGDGERRRRTSDVSDMCIVYKNSCSYLLFISKSHSLSLLRSRAKKCNYTIEA